MKLNIPARAINFVAPFVANNDVRYYLQGIYVRPMDPDEGGGVLIAGCNGYTIGMWRDDTDAVCERPAILRVTPGLLAACRKNSDKRRVVIAGDRLTVTEPGHWSSKCPQPDPMEVHVQPALDWVPGVSKHQPWEMAGGAQSYPDIGRPIPDPTDNGASGKLNSVYVERVAKAFREASHDKRYRVGINMRQADMNGTALVISEDVPQAVAIIMPMHANSIDGCVHAPTWTQRVKAASARRQAAKSAPLPVHEPSDAGPPDDDRHAWALVHGGAA